MEETRKQQGGQPALELIGISKSFGDVTANEDISLQVYRGEILAVLGENGSGKSTLMNIIDGIYIPDKGEIRIDGKPAHIRSPKDAYRYRIGMVHQEFKLVNNFTATENIVLGLKDEKGFDLDKAADRIREISALYGLRLDPAKKIYDMTVSEKQMVEIIKALYRGADILILDEPTAVLTPQEIDNLFSILRRMKENGETIMIITHKLQEVLALSDRVAVLRKGKLTAIIPTDQANEALLTEKMVGKKMDLHIQRSKPKSDITRLKVRQLDIRSNDRDDQLKINNVSFTIRAGEIFGIAGISGSGQKELLEGIAGLQEVAHGSVQYVNPKTGMTEELIGMTPDKIRSLGVRLSFVPEERLGMGLVGDMDLTDNMMLRSYDEDDRWLLNRAKPRAVAEDIVTRLNVVTPSLETPVRKLSGGNVQKILVGREMAASPALLMVAYPVRGLDVNSSYQIFNLLNEEKEKGVAIIYVGEDLDTMLALCDRIMVLNEGKLSGIVDARESSKEEIGLMMTRSQSYMDPDQTNEIRREEWE